MDNHDLQPDQVYTWDQLLLSGSDEPERGIIPLARSFSPPGNNILVDRVWRCQYSTCSGLRFQRKYELERHDLAMHQNPVQFYCPVGGCARGTQGFKRLDNTIAHIKSIHDQNSVFSCPVTGCNTSACLDLLLLHYQQHTLEEQNQSPQSHTILDKLSIAGCKCPVKGCKKWFPSSEFGNHVVSKHNYSERSRKRAELRDTGFGVDGHPICPVCSMTTTINNFEPHLLQSHGITCCPSQIMSPESLVLANHHRRAILRHVSTFAEHPIFGYLTPATATNSGAQAI